MIAALAISKTLNDYSDKQEIKARIKWINDVFVEGKKISGVLVTF